MSLKNLTQMEQVVFKLVARDDLGRVRHFEILYDHESVDLTNEANREFLIAWLPRGVLQKVNAQGSKKRGAN